MRQARHLLERDTQLSAADTLLNDASNSEGRLALVEGPPGIGKTVFLSAVIERASARGAQVLTARAGELERALRGAEGGPRVSGQAIRG